MLSLVAVLATGCQLSEPQGWQDQLQADGPCWRVDLLDGLDEGSTDELQDLYACVNARGTFEPLAGVVQALEGQGRAGVPLGIELARLINGLPDLDLDVWGLAGAALDLLRTEDRLLEPLLELVVELLYGRPYATVAATVDLEEQEELDQGLLVPLLPVIGSGAAAVLDDGQAVPELLVEALRDPALADASCTLAGLAESTDPTVRDLADDIVADLGEALSRAADSSNDRWPEASGNSLRDLARVALLPASDDGRSLVAATEDQLLPILDDAGAVANLRETLDLARQDGRLAPLPAQLEYLARVDVDGGVLSAEEDSALYALLRLLDGANTEVVCSVDIVVTDLEIDLGNLSVALLAILADQDPDAVASGVDILGDVLGWGLTETTLDLVAGSGLCPAIDQQLVDDLASIDRLNDDQVGDLLVVLLLVLDDLQEGEQDHLADVVDLLSLVVERQAVRPLEEALLDLGSTAFSSKLVELTGLILDPSALQVQACPAGSQPLDLEGLVGLVAAALRDRSGGSPVEVLDPLLQVLLDHDGTWLAVEHLATLAAAPDARVHDLLAIFSGLLAADPDLELFGDLAGLLAAPELSGPVLRMAEDPVLLDELGAAPSDAEGPLPFLARLVVGGTLEELLRTLDLVLGTLDSADPPDGQADRSASP